MPYAKISDLPDAVKKLPKEAADAWMKAFNAAFMQYKGDEGKSAAVAWAAVQKMGYVKKGDNWVKAEAGYVKGLGLKPGDFVHPQDPSKKLHITVEDLEKHVAHTNKFIDAGGQVRLTTVHPKTNEEKIESTLGYITAAWMDYDSGEPFVHITPLPSDANKLKQWVDDGKLTTVSPGIFNNVVTSIGILPSLIDHVAATPDPFNLGQNGFLPVNAEKFSEAFLFFENKFISQEQGKEGLLEQIQSLLERTLVKFYRPPEGGNKMELTLEQAKQKIAELEAQQKKDVEERDKTILTLQTENKTLKDAETKRVEMERKTALDNVNKKIDKLIEEKKLKPEGREKLVNDFTTLYDNKIEGAEEILFNRFEKAEGFKNQLKQNQIVVKEEIVDINTKEGQDKLHNLCLEKAYEMKAKDPDGKGHTENFYFEAARDAVYAELGIGQESES